MDFLHERGRIYLADDTGRTVAEVLFPAESDGTVDITHTAVDSSLQGQGVADRLIEAVAEQLRSQHKKTRLTCSYAVKWFSRHPEYKDLIIKEK